MKRGVPTAAATTPVGTMFSVRKESQAAAASVSASIAMPVRALMTSSPRGDLRPRSLAALGAMRPTKLMTPAAVTKVETSQTPAAASARKTGAAGSPRAAAPSEPSEMSASALGESARRSAKTGPARRESHVTPPQPFCARSPAPQRKTFSMKSARSSTTAEARAPKSRLTTMPEITTVTPVMFESPVMSTMSPNAPSAPASEAAASQSFESSGRNAETMTIASHAPDDVPSVRGEAMGFLVSCCMRLPVRPRSAPPMSDITNLGSVPCT